MNTIESIPFSQIGQQITANWILICLSNNLVIGSSVANRELSIKSIINMMTFLQIESIITLKSKNILQVGELSSLKGPNRSLGQLPLLHLHAVRHTNYISQTLCQWAHPEVSRFLSCSTSQNTDYIHRHCEYPGRGSSMQHHCFTKNFCQRSRFIEHLLCLELVELKETLK